MSRRLKNREVNKTIIVSDMVEFELFPLAWLEQVADVHLLRLSTVVQGVLTPEFTDSG